ncbi:MAG: replication-relaxation family protein [Anaerolineae bacterium]|nr:replication-relaxation family protein [Anaerolineae bacterium]
MKRMKRKRHERQSDPKPMRLTQRDVAIIEAVNQFRVLKQEQIQTLFFGSKATAQFRLEKLYDHGYLERKFLPVVLGEGRSPTLYVLDKRGADLLRAERGMDELTWYSSSKDLKTDFLEHTIAINEVMVASALAARQHGFTLETWLGENDIKADYDRVKAVSASGKYASLPVVPDSFFTIVAHERRYPFFLELDRGTMTLARFKEKVSAYAAYYASGGYEKRYKLKSIRVLTVVSTKSKAGGDKRVENLRQATEAATNERWFWFATLAEVQAHDMLIQPFWRQANEAEYKPLIAQPHSFR